MRFTNKRKHESTAEAIDFYSMFCNGGEL